VLIVYDKFDTDYLGYGLGVLQNAYDVAIYKKINAEWTLTFNYPIDDEKYSLIQVDNFIKVDDQLYIIRKKEEQRSESNELSAVISCEHIFFELLDEYIESLEIENGTTQLILDQLLSGTRFTGDSHLTSSHQYTAKKWSAVKAINHIIALADCEVLPDNFTVGLYSQIGNDFGVQFRYRKNIRNIKKTIDSSNVITKLYVHGKDDLTITPLVSSNAGNYPRLKVGEITFSEIETTETLTEKGLEYLASVDKPLVTYELDIVDLSALVEYGPSEAFGLGDTITVIDEDLNTNVSARIVEMEYYPFEREKGRVVLANFVDNIADTVNKFRDTQQFVDQIKSNRKVNTYFLDGIINTLQNQIKASGAYSSAQVLENQGVLFENTDSNSADHGALYMGPGIFAIANTQDAQGNWIYRTFGTGSGFSADVLNTGTLNAALVKVIGDSSTFIDGAGITIDNGITRILQNGSVGFKIQKKISGSWVDQFYVDATGNIHMNGGSIDWSGVNTPSNMLTSDSPKLTKIDSTGVYTGSVSADQITTGTLDASEITVTNLNANSITAGTIKANQIDSANLPAEKLRKNGDSGTYGTMGGDYGDLSLFHGGIEFFRVRNNASSTSLQANSGSGTLLDLLNSNGSNTWAHGTWDFSGATVTGLNITAKFG
jgi:phage minor structural protein